MGAKFADALLDLSLNDAFVLIHVPVIAPMVNFGRSNNELDIERWAPDGAQSSLSSVYFLSVADIEET